MLFVSSYDLLLYAIYLASSYYYIAHTHLLVLLRILCIAQALLRGQQQALRLSLYLYAIYAIYVSSYCHIAPTHLSFVVVVVVVAGDDAIYVSSCDLFLYAVYMCPPYHSIAPTHLLAHYYMYSSPPSTTTIWSAGGVSTGIRLCMRPYATSVCGLKAYAMRP